MGRVDRFAPGLAALQRYDRANLPADISAGLAVAAVAVPVGIAYAVLAGFGPDVGLYSTIPPLLAYAIFGTSRQLIIGPDAATCAVIASAVAPLAASDPSAYAGLSAALALMTGLICIGASFLRLGVLADFLSRPILVGFLNGVALSIMLGQADKIFGFAVSQSGILPRLIEVAGKLGETHVATFAVAAGTLAIMVMVTRLAPWVPSALAGMVLAGIAVPLLDLGSAGVQTVGVVPGGLPALPVANRRSHPILVAACGRGGACPRHILEHDADSAKLCRQEQLRRRPRPGLRGARRGKCRFRAFPRLRRQRR
jgi:MFS superfamily sulfate permease-like transporter